MPAAGLLECLTACDAAHLPVVASGLPPLSPATALREWQFAPLVTAGLVILAGWYLTAAWRVRRRHPARPWPITRTAAFFAGLAAICLATQSSIGAYDDVLFSDHMVQHLLLIMVAPPLLVFGRPVTLLLHSVGNPVHKFVKRIARSKAVTALTWPPGVCVVYCTVIVVTHLTPLMNLVLENEAVHNAEHALYLITGYLFFLPVVGSEPIRWRLSMLGRFVMLLVTMPVDILVGVILMNVPHELFPAYARVGRTWGPSPLTDLHDGGVIMWVGSDMIMTVIAVMIAVRMIHDPRRSGQLGGWLERARRTAVLGLATGAGLPASAARTIDDGSHLASYNACLDSLDSRGEPHQRRAGPGSPTTAHPGTPSALE
jgi:cytochrome c oxidase assembly factor CtaG